MIPKVFVRSAYNYDMDAASNESGLKCEDVSLAVQSSRDEVDINTIVRRFGLTGELPTDLRAPTFGDFVGINDYHSAMNAVARANEAFMEMPAEVRSRFGNDPQEFVAFCSDPANASEMAKLGLLSPAAVKAMDDKAAADAAAVAAAIAAGKVSPASVAGA